MGEGQPVIDLQAGAHEYKGRLIAGQVDFKGGAVLIGAVGQVIEAPALHIPEGLRHRAAHGRCRFLYECKGILDACIAVGLVPHIGAGHLPVDGGQFPADGIHIAFHLSGSIIPVVVEIPGEVHIVVIAPVLCDLLPDQDQVHQHLGHGLSVGAVVALCPGCQGAGFAAEVIVAVLQLRFLLQELGEMGIPVIFTVVAVEKAGTEIVLTLQLLPAGGCCQGIVQILQTRIYFGGIFHAVVVLRFPVAVRQVDAVVDICQTVAGIEPVIGIVVGVHRIHNGIQILTGGESAGFFQSLGQHIHIRPLIDHPVKGQQFLLPGDDCLFVGSQMLPHGAAGSGTAAQQHCRQQRRHKRTQILTHDHTSFFQQYSRYFALFQSASFFLARKKEDNITLHPPFSML